MNLWSKAKLLAIFSLVLYCFDSGSDIVVGVNLILSCHEKYGYSVLSLVFLPGLAFGFWRFSMDPDCYHFLRALIFPIWMLPYTLKRLIRAIMEKDDADMEKAK